MPELAAAFIKWMTPKVGKVNIDCAGLQNHRDLLFDRKNYIICFATAHI